MADKVKLEEEPKKIGNYFLHNAKINYVSSGCELLDRALGGGMAQNRVFHIVGGSGSGKSLQALEFAANFLILHPKGRVIYVDSETAYDSGYADALGIPADRIEIINIETVGKKPSIEDLHRLLKRTFVDGGINKEEILVVADSIDGLAVDKEMLNSKAKDEDLHKQEYNTAKAFALSKMFKNLNDPTCTNKGTLLLISQIRDNVGGGPFSAKSIYTGGKALLFYASQQMWITETGKLKKTIKKSERVYGTEIKCNVKKNRVGLPHRQVKLFIRYGFGIWDMYTNLMWLKDESRINYSASYAKYEKANTKPTPLDFVNRVEDYEDVEFFATNDEINAAVNKAWNEIETSFLPKRRKYNN